MKQDVIVIGAGIIGLATAEQLLLHGAMVTVLERGDVGQESSWAGGGILSPLCPWHYSDAVTRLTSRGASLFAAWADSLHAATGIDPEYQVSGLQVLPPFDAWAAQCWCEAHDVRLERGPASPPLSDEISVLTLPDVAQVRNPPLLRALRARVAALGGRIIEHSPVHDVVVEGGRVQAVAAPGGMLSADSYIVTAGAWSTQVLGRYALHLDIKPVRGQMLLFKFPAPPLRHILLQNSLYLIPRRDGHVLIGSTLEDVGFDSRTTVTARDDLLNQAREILPQLPDMTLLKQWSGLRPGSPHNIPAIGRHPQLENLYVNSGHFRYGVTMAPASAEILLNEIKGINQPFDVKPYHSGWGVQKAV